METKGGFPRSSVQHLTRTYLRPLSFQRQDGNPNQYFLAVGIRNQVG